MDSHLVGKSAAQDVPIPPNIVKAAASDMNRMPKNLKNFTKPLSGFIMCSTFCD